MRDGVVKVPDGPTLPCTDVGTSTWAAAAYIHGPSTGRLGLVSYEDRFRRPDVRFRRLDRPVYSQGHFRGVGGRGAIRPSMSPPVRTDSASSRSSSSGYQRASVPSRSRERDGVLICKGGTLNEFLAARELAPEDSASVVVLTNTGGLDNRGVPEPLAAALTRRLLDMPANPVADDVVPHPEVWDELCGWYAMDACTNTHLFLRIGFGSGLEVAGRHDHLMLMPLQPVPGVSAAMVMHPDDPQDPRVFRVEFEQYETSRIVFTRDTPPRLLVDVMSFQTRPDWTNPAGLPPAWPLGAQLSPRDVTRGRRSA